MPSNYRKTDEYIWYKAGDNGLRPRWLPYASTDQHGRVIVAAGEIYCRCTDDDGESLCPNRSSYSTIGALKKHITTAHQLQVAPSAPGGLSAADDNATAVFYKNMYKAQLGREVVPDTPRKAKAVVKDQDLLPVPYKDNGKGVQVFDVERMRNAAGLEPGKRCTTCAT